MWRRLKAWLFRGGDYPDKGVHADRPLLDRLVANLNSTSAGAAPKLDLEHGPTGLPRYRFGPWPYPENR